MIRRLLFGVPVWSVAVPLAACLLLVAVWGSPLGWILLLFVAAALIAAVLVAVHHAEVIAHRVGEPFGTLVLALAVTIIEVSLIVSLMLSGGEAASALARDTVYATVMIVCNGTVGLCLLMGALRHRVLVFRIEGTSPALSVLATLTVLTLVLPSFTSSTPGPTLSPVQLAFVGLVSLTLYGVFVFVQTVRHRSYFLPVEVEVESEEMIAATPPSVSSALISLALLFLCLFDVVGLAKALAPNIEAVVKTASAPHAVVGIAIALMVLLPETWAALRSAIRNRMQTSFNLALGSALATIGLTIPAVAATTVALGLRLELGLPPKEMVLLVLTLMISSMTLAGGRSTVLQGAVHLILFAAFLFLAVVP
jgi:Ca2+:H+ antiporter